MSSKYPGGVITKSPAATVGGTDVDFGVEGGSAPGIWSVDQAMALQKAGAWPSRIKEKYLWSWGSNDNGQIGYNTVLNRSSPVQIGALATWLLVSGGHYSAIATKTNGTIWTWGRNQYGQIGDNSLINRSSPVQVGAYNPWSLVAAGAYHNIATKADGTLWSFGYGVQGQLGHNNILRRSSPVQVGTDTNWSQIAGGLSGGFIHSIATKTNGTLWSFGANNVGQLGNNTVVYRSSPVQIGSGTDWYEVACGRDRTLSIKTNGTLWAWGRGNTYGTLGDSSLADRSSPVQIGADTNWSQISAGEYHNISSKTDGTLWAWGSNSQGQIGDNTGIFRSSPVQIGADTNWNQVAGGHLHTIATKTNGTIWTWGGNDYGNLGNNTVLRRSSPVQVGALTTWYNVAANQNFTVATKTDGTIWTWGNNVSGQLGQSDVILRSSPVQVGILATWSKIAAGAPHVLSIKTDGNLWAWGANDQGNLGQNTSGLTDKSSPVQIGTVAAETTNWSQVAGGASYFLATKTDGTMWAWGLGDNGQLGINIGNITRSSPVQVGALTTWSKLFSGGNNSLAIKTDGTLWTWGDNTYGNSGLNDASVKRSSPVQVGSGTTWNQIATGVDTTLATKTDGTLWSWGRNQTGQLGDNTIVARSSPVQVGSLTTWSKVAAGIQHFIATKTDGTLWSFGYNSGFGQLGDNTILNRSSPVQIGALTTWSKIASSRFASLAAKTDSTLWVWGNNTNGQLGQDDVNFGPLGATVNHRSSPVQIGALVYGWSEVSGGSDSATAIRSDGTLWGWGRDQSGQLGVGGGGANKSSPVQVGADTNWRITANGSDHTTALKTNGTLWGWGSNGSGHIGDNTGTNKTSPVQIGALTTWVKISTGTNTVASIKTDGTLWSWGSNNNGQIGDNTKLTRSSPVQVGAGTDWYQVSCGTSSTIAIKTNGTLWAWGDSRDGRLGLNTITPYRSSPVQVGADTDWNRVSTHSENSMAIKTNGTLWGWGNNTSGNLGDNTTVARSSPVQIGALTTWSQISKYSNNSAALKTDGTIWAWGANDNGDLGDNTIFNKSSPVQIGTLNTWSKISVGTKKIIAIKANTSLWSWGNNSYGELGINRQTAGFNRSSPVQVGTNPASETTNWRRLSSSIGNQFYAITAD